MFIDALGYEIASRYAFLEDLLPHRQRVKMQFGYSSTAIPTILSGKPPREHRHLSFYYYSPQSSPFKIFKYLPFQWLPSCVGERWRLRHALSKVLAKAYGFTGYFELYSMPFGRLPYFDYSERRDIFAPGGLGPVENLADILAASGVPGHISNWRLSEEQNIGDLNGQLVKGDIRFAFLYTAALDGMLHMHIGDDRIIGEKLKSYADTIRSLIQTAGQRYSKVSFTVISDHGMTPRMGVYDLRSQVDDLPLKFGVDYAAAYDSTMARFWFLSGKGRELIMPLLAAVPCGRLLSASEKAGFGIDFDDDMYGGEILLMNPGVQLEPCDMGRKSLPGMHGFDPADADSDAACLSTDPLSPSPVWVGDYFSMMRDALVRATNPGTR